ncbi:Histone deacetylase hda1 [Ceratobasidium sp. 428]|nr:Histone deacetylase hda1 [Ceratobasidium sp. 428]
MENTWIIDTSTNFLRWCTSHDLSIIDLNMHPVAVQGEDAPTAKEREKTAKTAILNAWDNLAELSDAQEIVIVAHGTACLSVVELINQRFQSVRAKVKGVVQVCGMHNVPKTPAYEDDIRKWYFRNSLAREDRAVQ